MLRYALLAILLAALVRPARGLPASGEPGHVPEGLTAQEQEEVRSEVRRLEEQIASLRARRPPPARLVDVEVFLKAVRWALDYEDRLASADLALLRKALRRASERAVALADGSAPWDPQKGRLVRGSVSAIDGSVQPYGVIVPASYDAARLARLDVVLHGSSKPTGMSELRFMMPFDEGDASGKPVTDANWIELRPLGRVENCYRWAGETDVFEAIADVCRCYRIDPDRIVLRGMSMGASGTWHLGLKHPDRFAALAPYCGYVDTHQFSLSPVENFVKVGALPPQQELGLHMLDSVDYAANAGLVPVVAAIGEKDPFFQAHVLMGQAMEREGLHLLNLISPGTAHVQDPATFAEQMRRIGEIAARGADRDPDSIRFVTWTLKYPRCRWIEFLGLKQHYARAEIRARRDPDGTIRIEEPVNVTRFAVRMAVPAPPGHVGRQPGRLNARSRQISALQQSQPGSERSSPVGQCLRPCLVSRSLDPWPQRKDWSPHAHSGCGRESALLPNPAGTAISALRVRGVALSRPLPPGSWPLARQSGAGSASEPASASRLLVGGQAVRLPLNPKQPVLGLRGETWTYLGERDAVPLTGKRPGLQGPIDDAFTAPFLCVRGTGKPWNPTVGAWAEASLKRFAYEWRRYFHGDLPVKDAAAVTATDVRRCNLILFGDPGSNPWIAKTLPKLPLLWTRMELRMGGNDYRAVDHAPVLIAPNPLPGGEDHYVVLNSGHTFHEKELASLNYLLFPRLGDWAVMKVGASQPGTAPYAVDEEAVRAAFFNEEWR